MSKNRSIYGKFVFIVSIGANRRYRGKSPKFLEIQFFPFQAQALFLPTPLRLLIFPGSKKIRVEAIAKGVEDNLKFQPSPFQNVFWFCYKIEALRSSDEMVGINGSDSDSGLIVRVHRESLCLFYVAKNSNNNHTRSLITNSIVH